MKLLIAGGAGYIGSVLTPRLCERGYDVTVVDTLWFGNYLPSSVAIIKKDVFALCEADLKGYDQVVFIAGLSNDPMAEFSPSKNFIYNAAAPAYLGYIAKRVGVKRIIFAGTCSVYGYTEGELYDEMSPTISPYPYGIAKLQGEQSLIGMADENFSVISLRKGTVCGYSPRMRFDLIINTMFRSALENNVITINNPAIWRPIVSIEDAVTAYIRAVEAEESISGIFNIASGNYTVGEVGDYVQEVVNGSLNRDVKLNIGRKQDYRNYKVSVDKAMNVLSFKPDHDVKSIVESLISHMDEYGDLGNDIYYNIRVFEKIDL